MYIQVNSKFFQLCLLYSSTRDLLSQWKSTPHDNIDVMLLISFKKLLISPSSNQTPPSVNCLLVLRPFLGACFEKYAIDTCSICLWAWLCSFMGARWLRIQRTYRYCVGTDMTLSNYRIQKIHLDNPEIPSARISVIYTCIGPAITSQRGKLKTLQIARKSIS